MNDVLPLPFDAAREMRKANLARADLIYQVAIADAERKARAANSDEGKTPQAPTRTDAMKVTIQPLHPSERLLSPREITEHARKLESGTSTVGKFFEASSAAVPLSVLWSEILLGQDDRNAQIALENGLVFHKGNALMRTRQGLPRLHLFQLIERIVLTVQVAHHLHRSPLPSVDWALDVTVESLGEYEVLLQGESYSSRSHPAPIQNWIWNYCVPAATFGDEALLGEFLLLVIEEICWGFGASQLRREGLLKLSKQQGLTLTPLPESGDDA